MLRLTMAGTPLSARDEVSQTARALGRSLQVRAALLDLDTWSEILTSHASVLRSPIGAGHVTLMAVDVAVVDEVVPGDTSTEVRAMLASRDGNDGRPDWRPGDRPACEFTCPGSPGNAISALRGGSGPLRPQARTSAHVRRSSRPSTGCLPGRSRYRASS